MCKMWAAHFIDFVVSDGALVWPMIAAGASNDHIVAAKGIRPLRDGYLAAADFFDAENVAEVGGEQTCRVMGNRSSSSECRWFRVTRVCYRIRCLVLRYTS